MPVKCDKLSFGEPAPRAATRAHACPVGIRLHVRVRDAIGGDARGDPDQAPDAVGKAAPAALAGAEGSLRDRPAPRAIGARADDAHGHTGAAGDVGRRWTPCGSLRADGAPARGRRSGRPRRGTPPLHGTAPRERELAASREVAANPSSAPDRRRRRAGSGRARHACAAGRSARPARPGHAFAPVASEGMSRKLPPPRRVLTWRTDPRAAASTLNRPFDTTPSSRVPSGACSSRCTTCPAASAPGSPPAATRLARGRGPSRPARAGRRPDAPRRSGCRPVARSSTCRVPGASAPRRSCSSARPGRPARARCRGRPSRAWRRSAHVGSRSVTRGGAPSPTSCDIWRWREARALSNRGQRKRC